MCVVLANVFAKGVGVLEWSGVEFGQVALAQRHQTRPSHRQSATGPLFELNCTRIIDECVCVRRDILRNMTMLLPNSRFSTNSNSTPMPLVWETICRNSKVCITMYTLSVESNCFFFV